MGSKSGGTQTVQEKADPWAPAQAYLTGGQALVPVGYGSSGFSSGQSSADAYKYRGGGNNPSVNTNGSIQYAANGPKRIGLLPQAEELYKDSMKNPFSADELAAMDLMRGRMDRNYGLVNTGLDTLNRTARGDYLGQQNFMDAYGEGILNDVNAQFSRSGRTGSGYAAQAAAKGLAQGAAPLYAQERQLQQQAALAAPQYQAGQYGLLDTDIDALMQAGFMQHNRPYENLQNYANVVLPSAGQGGTSSSSQPLYRNPVASGLGGAMSGYAMGGALGGAANGAAWGPYGAMIGGALGLLSG